MNEEDIIYKYDLSAGLVRRIQRENSTINDFCKKYVDYLIEGIKGKLKIPDIAKTKLTNYFDLSNAYSLGETSGYADLIVDILKIKPGFIVYEPFEDIVKSAMEEALSEQDRDVLNALYRLDGDERDLNQLERAFRTSKEELLLTKKRSVRRLAAGRHTSQLQQLNNLIVKREIATEALRDILEEENAFSYGDYSKLCDKKVQLVIKILKMEIENISYDENYILESFKVKNRIRKSILNEEQKEDLLLIVDKKIREIATENRDSIVSKFHDRILKVKSSLQVKAIIKEISNSGLEKSDIESIISKLPEDKESEQSVELYREKLRKKIEFPQYELPVEDMNISEKAAEELKKADLGYVKKIITYSKRELTKLGNIKKQYVDELMREIENLGYDIPEDETISIEEYNQDEIYSNNFTKIAEEIQNSDFDENIKADLLGTVLEKAISDLKMKYLKLDRKISTYKDIFRSHEIAKIETADEGRYRRKVKEAEKEKIEVEERLKFFENR